MRRTSGVSPTYSIKTDAHSSKKTLGFFYLNWWLSLSQKSDFIENLSFQSENNNWTTCSTHIFYKSKYAMQQSLEKSAGKFDL